MAEEQDRLPKKSVPLISKLLSPENLRKIIVVSLIIFILLITTYVTLNLISDIRPDDAPHWYRELPVIKLTSDYNSSYGTFFCSIKLYLGYNNSSVVDEIEDKTYDDKLKEGKVSSRVMDAIIQVISKQNYYLISSVDKLKDNLTPRIIEELNLKVFRTPKAIVDVNYAKFVIQRNNEAGHVGTTYYDLGRFVVPINKNKYMLLCRNAQCNLIYYFK